MYDSQLEILEHVYVDGRKMFSALRLDPSGKKQERVHFGKMVNTTRCNEMRMHRDNGWRDCNKDTLRFANHDVEMNSQIFGSDVITVTSGDTMSYDLIKPWYNADPPQDYRISADTARKNILLNTSVMQQT